MEQHKESQEQSHLAAPSGPVPSALTVDAPLHTRGPWVAKALAFDAGYAILMADRSKPGVHMRRIDKFGAFSLADATLIAAAPELLKACKQALYALKGREHDQFLRDAIAKATGSRNV